MKVEKIKNTGLCLGCGLCKSLLQEKCEMKIDGEGFYKPFFLSKLSSEENDLICKVCPGIKIDNSGNETSSIWGNVKKVENAWASDGFVRKEASSGGVTSSLAIYLLEQKHVDGVLHVGVQSDTFLYNKLYLSRNREDVLKRCASRYAPAAVFDNIVDILDANPHEKYAFIGKPCDVVAMKNFLRVYPRYKTRILYFLAIFCAGMPSYNGTLKALDKFKKERPLDLRYRGDGWPGYFKATYADGSICKMTYNESWGTVLNRHLNFRCKICPDGIGALADIASGDAWNTKDGYPDFTEAAGKNFCFIRTDAGQKLFDDALKAGYIESENVNVDDVRYMQNYQYDRRHIVGWRIAVVQLFTFHGLSFKGLGYNRFALRCNIKKGLRNAWGTFKRMMKSLLYGK